MSETKASLFKLFQQGKDRMVALFRGPSESDDWLENMPFDKVFKSGWHLFAKEELISVEDARAQGVWIDESQNPAVPSALPMVEVSTSELLRLYCACSENLFHNTDLVDKIKLLDKVSGLLKSCDHQYPAYFVEHGVRLQWHLRRIDALVGQWSLSPDFSTGLQIFKEFTAVQSLDWPEDQSEGRDKAAFNAAFWWNKAIEFADNQVRSLIADSRWAEASEILEQMLNAVNKQSD
jgi:hypothetical protein